MPDEKSRDGDPSRFSSPRCLSYLPGVDVVSGLVAVLVVVHFLLLLAGGPIGAPWYYQNFALSWGEFSHGKIWQLLTYGLLHSDGLHLVINLLVLWLVGKRVLLILGSRHCLQMMFFGVLAGGLLHLLTGVLLLRNGYAESNLVGISGACLALLLTLTTLSPNDRFRFLPVSGKNLGLGLIIAELLLWFMHPGLGLPVFSNLGELLVTWGGPGLFRISHACHLGGALAGYLLARRLLAPLSHPGD